MLTGTCLKMEEEFIIPARVSEDGKEKAWGLMDRQDFFHPLRRVGNDCFFKFSFVEQLYRVCLEKIQQSLI